MLFSTAYHLFGCHSPKWRHSLLKLDLFGVSMALTGIYLAGLYTSFYNFPTIRQTYMCTTAVVLAGICAWAPQLTRLDGVPAVVKGNLSKPVLSVVRPVSRIGLLECIFVGIAAFGLLPAWHWVVLHGGLNSPHVVVRKIT